MLGTCLQAWRLNGGREDNTDKQETLAGGRVSLHLSLGYYAADSFRIQYTDTSSLQSEQWKEKRGSMPKL
jgi:hypothetical protein